MRADLSRRLRVLSCSVAAALALNLLVLGAVAPKPVRATGEFVERNGAQLMLDGEPYTFRGLNVYNANSHGWCWYAMNTGPALDQALTAMGARKNVMRAWFFQSLAQPTPDTPTQYRTWDAFDHTLEVAAAQGMKVIPTLTDQWGECGDGGTNQPKDLEWYRTGYTLPDPGMLVSYRDWVSEIVERYKDDPRIAFWQLINEAEATPLVNDQLVCPAGDAEPAQVLKSWATDMAQLVKSIDTNHLLSLGTIGGGQCGAQEAQYQSLHDIPEIDLCEYHDYSPAQPMPGDQWNGLQVRLNQCGALNKPLFVGEVGIIPNQVGGTLQDRANALLAKLEAQSQAGVQGFLAWAWNNDGTGDPASFDIGPGDPLLNVLMVNHRPFAYPGFNRTAIQEIPTDVYMPADNEDEDGDRLMFRGATDPPHGTVSCSPAKCVYTSDPGYLGADQFQYTVADGKGGTATAQMSLTVVAPAAPGPIVRISESEGGDVGNGDSLYASVSADGRFVAFYSAASNLVPGDTNNRQDVFLRDMQTGTIERISVSSSGVEGNSGSHRPRISADGRFVAFESFATNLVAGDTNGDIDIFVHDRVAGTTERVSIGSAEQEGSESSSEASISADGRYVAFVTNSSFDPNDLSFGSDVYLRDRQLGTTVLVSRFANGSPAGGQTPSVSSDGRYVAFGSDSQLSNDPNVFRDVYLRDMLTGSVELISVGPDGTAPTGSGPWGSHVYGGRSLSDDGRYVAFYSERRLITGDTPHSTDVYIRDRLAGTTTRLTGPVQPTGLSYGPSIARDGSFVVFQSEASNLVSGDGNGIADIFRYQVDTGGLEMVSADPGGQNAIGNYFPTVANSGSRIVWHSDSSTMVPGDAAGFWDIYAWTGQPPDPDADDDGVDDSIDAGDGAFDDGAGTTGSIVSTAGHTVRVAPDPDGVRITVEGTGTAKAEFTVCGFTLRLAPGSDVVVACGSITVQVLHGPAELILGGGLTVISIPDGVTGHVEAAPDGSFSVTNVSGTVPITVTVDGVEGTVPPGGTSTVEAWDFIGFGTPVDAPPVLNVLKAGQIVPLKWRLLDASGQPVLDLATATVSVRALDCDAGTGSDALEQIGSGGSTLQNLGDGYYQLNWKTLKSYGNACKTMRLDIGDGVLHEALFRFKK